MQLRSIDKMLQKLDASLSDSMQEGNLENKLQLQAKIEELKAERALLRFNHLKGEGESNDDD
jgi:hypothetical protein